MHSITTLIPAILIALICCGLQWGMVVQSKPIQTHVKNHAIILTSAEPFTTVPVVYTRSEVATRTTVAYNLTTAVPTAFAGLHTTSAIETMTLATTVDASTTISATTLASLPAYVPVGVSTQVLTTYVERVPATFTTLTNTTPLVLETVAVPTALPTTESVAVQSTLATSVSTLVPTTINQVIPTEAVVKYGGA